MYFLEKLNSKTIFFIILSIALMIFNCSSPHAFNKYGTYSYQFLDAKTGKILLERNPQQLLMPASVQKLFTAYAALKILGPKYQFKTQLFYRGKIKKQTLFGDIIVKFSGAPDLTTKDITKLLSYIKKLGIKKITGNIIIDDSIFNNKHYPFGWVNEEQNLCHAAPISAITINKNCFQVGINEKNGQIKISHYNNLMPRLAIKGVKVITHEDRGFCPLELTGNNSNYYSLSGCYNRKFDSIISNLNIAIRSPEQNVKKVISSTLKSMNINFNKVTIYSQYKQSSIKLVGTVNSAPLHKILSTFLLKSQNYIGEILIKTIGNKVHKAPGSWYNGIKALKTTLQSIGISTENIHFADGSGYSRKNLMNAESLNKLLFAIYNDKSVKPYFEDFLPQSGKTGTLATRFTSQNFDNYDIRAKTGYMENTTSLSGYIKKKASNDIVFTLLANSIKGDSKKLKEEEEELIVKLIKKL